MTHRHTARASLAVGALAAAVAGCASLPAWVPGSPNSAAALDARAAQMIAASFRDQGIARVERLRQDEANEACSKIGTGELPEALAKRIETANLATVRPPSDGRYLGDWKRGETLAQNGRGMTWTDASASPAGNGGNCYNCHRISDAEISYGTIGPSLHQYGKLRGVTDPASPAARAMIEYTWGKLWNARAYNACSSMPRFGHAGLLDESQLKDLMALLLDPRSPVNQ
jgi:sulfur-oxidizing protein SoxX